MHNRKYFLDINDLQFKQIRLPWRTKLIRVLFWLGGTVALTVLYVSIIENLFGSPKEKLLKQEIENVKLKYSLVNREINDNLLAIDELKMSDEARYRPVLGMDSLPQSFRNPGFGGIERFTDLDGYTYSYLMKSTKIKVEELKNIVNIQNESFKTIKESEGEWTRMWDYIPAICPVDVTIKRGDGLKYRDKHPVLGYGRWHHGQDFYAPYGSNVYATGNGKVIDAGWNSGGFGNYIKIDHGYGYQTIYGHLSKIMITTGLNVKRGDLIGLTGNSGTSSGPHLHYQIDLYGQHQNPLNFFNDDLSEDEYYTMITELTKSRKLRN